MSKEELLDKLKAVGVARLGILSGAVFRFLFLLVFLLMRTGQVPMSLLVNELESVQQQNY